MQALALTPAELQEVQAILREQVPHLEVWAFGSRTKGTAKPYSDLDLALITHAPLSLAQLASVTHAFDNSDLPMRVDLVDWAATTAAFRAIIERDKIPIQQT
jgi:predicted nucleotidyltransferase